VLLAVASMAIAAPASAAPEGQLTWGVHASLAPAWFDPAETTGISTPFMVLYAREDLKLKSR
jgi:peptide/nickel transport system substrate-binding protein